MPIISRFTKLHFSKIGVIGNTTENETSSNWAQFTNFDTNGLACGCTPLCHMGRIVIGKTGIYEISFHCSLEGVIAAAFELELELKINSTFRTQAHVQRGFEPTTYDILNVSASDQIALTIGDTVELWFRNVTNTDNILIKDCVMQVEEIHSKVAT